LSQTVAEMIAVDLEFHGARGTWCRVVNKV
jgi:hypothetical protein